MPTSPANAARRSSTVPPLPISCRAASTSSAESRPEPADGDRLPGNILRSWRMSNQTDIETLRRQLAATIHAHWRLFLAQGILMTVLGLLAVAVPNIATLA